ncbi:hypothetical protein [Mesorhizobium sp. B2-4-15]|uniref:hypothetical protein n=1 Tax=Mesorhizobium sp. B2-4-15 TaxID=2589934 RepID=UPI0015EFBE71|nr:hypothetical protein [Mesorhizobium sp. B2-4-15]
MNWAFSTARNFCIVFSVVWASAAASVAEDADDLDGGFGGSEIQPLPEMPLRAFQQELPSGIALAAQYR